MHNKTKKPPTFIDGYSESLWKSLAVKSLRMGWPAGLQAAAIRLPKSVIAAQLWVGLFEDVFPAVDEIAAAGKEIKGQQWDALCSRQTHHGRPGVTAAWGEPNMRARAFAAIETLEGKQSLWGEAKKLGIWLPRRSLLNFYKWVDVQPKDSGARRPLCQSLFAGMPACMADAHTFEGKARQTEVTLLSGHFENHLALAERVARDGGWELIRQEALATMLPAKENPQRQLF